MPELIIVLLSLIIPLGVLYLIYRFGKQAGENKILRQMQDESRRKVHE